MLRRAAVAIGIGVWAIGTTVVAVSLLARHAVALPSSSATAIDAPSSSESSARWSMVHVLYSECRCSQRIADHLSTSERPTDLNELVLLVGEDGALARRLRTSGFQVTVVTEAQLQARYEIEAAPLLLITDPAGERRYAGGYTREKQGAQIHDLKILASLREGESPNALPLLGCAVSDRLKAAINPLGLP